MFRSAVNKLTAWYVAALLIFIVVFSVPVYRIASDRLDRTSRRQGDILIQKQLLFQGPPSDDIVGLRQAVVQDEKSDLLRQISIIDVILLVIGTTASYYFAKKTLRPIEEAHIAQTRFTADASHQLRTPLATMQSEIEVALRNGKASKSELESTLTSNLEEIARLNRLSTQLLLLTKIDNNVLTSSEFSWSKTVSRKVSNIENQYNMKISSNIENNITVRGEESLLSEVVTILLENAVKYADKKHPKIEVNLNKSSKKIVLVVSDNGPGIDTKDLTKIFDRFYRGKQSIDNNSGGNGLGLALAKEISEKHGGHISVNTRLGKGSSFILTLPLK